MKFLNNIIRICCLALLCLAAASPVVAGEWDRVSSALRDGHSDAVKSLSRQERAILRATVALKTDQPDQALTMLASARHRKDPLVALLEAEAHRRQAIHAVQQAGAYAGDMGQEKLLAAANLNDGLGEANARLRAFIDKLDRAVGDPVDILLPGPNVADVFMFDKARNRLFVYQPTGDGRLKQITDEYVVTGTVVGDKQHRGDGRTPHGIYRFVKKLQGRQLESRYGPVAFPIDYPNELDVLHNKDGSGIWLHGYPMDVNRRPPQDTRGCFSMPNDRLMRISKYVKLHHSWVIVGEHLQFGQKGKKQQLLNSVQRDIEAWRRDWMSLNTEAYLSHYQQNFHSGKRDLAAWKRYKRRVNANKRFVDVRFSNMTLIHDPNRWPEGEVTVAEFDQSYRSSNYSDRGRKRLYLARKNSDSAWKILLEESLTP